MTISREKERPKRRPQTSEPVPLRTEPGIYAYDHWRNLSVGVWVGQATAPAVRRLFEMSVEMSAQHPEGRSSVLFVADQLPAPPPDAQAEFTRIYDLPGLACTVVVLEGSGFWAAGIRGMSANAHRSAASGTVSLHMVTSIEEAVAWLPEQHFRRTGVKLLPEELKQVLSKVRQTAGARALQGSRGT